MDVKSLSASAVAHWEAAPLTYAEIGATKGELPSGYATSRLSRPVVGWAFEVAGQELMTWRIHQRAGLEVHASGDVTDGAVVVVGIGRGRLSIPAPCRVVYVVREQDRIGFAYGTLPGHPVSGEESFVLNRAADGSVTFTITAFSRPATLLARASGPVGRVVQRLVTDRYLRAASREA
jgi:uncharacterized protein (UPF0548 family)